MTKKYPIISSNNNKYLVVIRDDAECINRKERLCELYKVKSIKLFGINFNIFRFKVYDKRYNKKLVYSIKEFSYKEMVTHIVNEYETTLDTYNRAMNKIMDWNKQQEKEFKEWDGIIKN